jgi:molybdenum cofactor synthesis domain-containing protein
VIVGNEVLTGKVTDVNTAFLARRLFELGVELRGVQVVPDEIAEIAQAVRSVSARVDHVFTTGGLGPTHDDVTLLAVAEAFEVKLVHSPTLELLMGRLYGLAPSLQLSAACRVPEGAEILHFAGATYPQLVLRNVYLFPGVPELVQRKFELLVDRFQSDPFTSETIELKASELQIVTVLDQAVADYPSVRFGSYPTYADGSETVLLTLDGRVKGDVERAQAWLRTALRPWLE